VIARVLAAAVLAAGAAAAPARADGVTLVDPTTALTAEPPFAAASAGRDQDAPAARQRVDSREVVTTGVDGAGTPVSVTVDQRLDVVGTGDYVFTVPAPVRSVAAARGSQSAPGQRAGAILWAGFSDRYRRLSARARLWAPAAARLLPLRLALRASVDGRPLRPGERRSGRLDIALTLRNVTAIRAPSAAGAGDVPRLVRALDAARRGVFPYGGVAIPLRSPPAARTARIEAPLAISGEIDLPAGQVREIIDVGHGRTERPAGTAGSDTGRGLSLWDFAFRLGDGSPLTQTVRISARVKDAAAPHIRVTARPVSPVGTLAPPAGRPSWRAALRAGDALAPRRLLDLAEDAHLREARARQYDAFLANPGPPGGANAARYVFVTAASASRPGGDGGSGGMGTLGVVLVAAGAVLAAGAAVIGWAHL
jgi:hypothetical protein